MPGWDDIKWSTYTPSLGYAGPPAGRAHSTLAVVKHDGGRYSVWDYHNHKPGSGATYEGVDLFAAVCIVNGILNGLTLGGDDGS
jgi:hypothetical protein